MANETYIASMFNPEVCADMLNELLDAQLKALKYAKVDKTLVGRAGDTVTVPKWDYIGEAVDTNEGANISITEMGHTKSVYTIKKAAKGVVLSTEAIESGLGDPKGTAVRQLAKSLKDKTDSDIYDAAYEATLRFDGSSGAISYAGIVNANALFQDENEGNSRTMFIHPMQFATLQLDPNFTSKDKFDKTIIPEGTLGQIAGNWIHQSRKVRHEDVTAGARTVTIGGTIAAGDKFTVVLTNEPAKQIKFEYVAVANDDATKVAAALVALITAEANAHVSATNSAGVITLTEAAGWYGVSLHFAPVVKKVSTAGTIALGGTYAGVCNFLNPIIKNEIDSSETEYTEAELPAIKVFLKKEAKVVPDYDNTNDTWVITATKLYGVALTNAAKVVVATYQG